MEIYSAAATLFLVMDPLGNIPVFLTILKDYDPKRRRRIMIRELLIALVVALLFLFLGKYILGLFSLRPEAVSIAGGIVLFIIAMRMIFPQRGTEADEYAGQEPFVVPLAIPLVAGPSLLATLLIFSRTGPEHIAHWTIALLIAWGAAAAILMASELFFKVLRERGLTAMERLMGMLLVALSVQMFLDGIGNYFGA
jgi:multiple antibiotic resistance protein